MRQLYLLMRIGGQRTAIDTAQVRSVIEVGVIHPVPRAPHHVVGLTAMRSQCLTVIDCRATLGIENPCAHGERSPVVEVDGNAYVLLVDAVDDVLKSEADPVPVPGHYARAWQSVGVGMVEGEHGPLLVVDVARLIGLPNDAAPALAA